MNERNMDRVLQEARDTMTMADGARDSLDARAQQLVQAAGLIVVIVSVIKLPQVLAGPSFLGRLAFAVAFFAFTGMVWAALRVWWPRQYGTPGTSLAEWDETYYRSLIVDDEEGFKQVYADYQGVVDLLVAVNLRKARWLQWAMVLFLVQIAGLLGLALLA